MRRTKLVSIFASTGQHIADATSSTSAARMLLGKHPNAAQATVRKANRATWRLVAITDDRRRQVAEYRILPH